MERDLFNSSRENFALSNINTDQLEGYWHVTPKKANSPTGAVVYSLAFSDNNPLITESSSGYAERWHIPQVHYYARIELST